MHLVFRMWVGSRERPSQKTAKSDSNIPSLLGKETMKLKKNTQIPKRNCSFHPLTTCPLKGHLTQVKAELGVVIHLKLCNKVEKHAE